MAKRKRTAIKRQTNDDKIIGATVTTSDRTAGRFRRTDAKELARRIQSMVLWCMYFNATNCAQHTMRLCRKTGSVGSSQMPGKRVTDRNRLKRLMNPNPSQRGVGRKAASMAEAADGDIEIVQDAPVLDLLNNANPWQRGTTFGKACFLQWEAFGRRYINLVQPHGEVPTELFVMYTDRVRPVPNVDGFLTGYMYGRDTANEQFFPVDEVIWQQFAPNPLDPYGGLGPLHSVFQEADIYAASTISELSMWNKGARPDFAVKVPQTTTDDQLKQMREMIEGRHQGPSKRGDFWFFRDGEVTPLQFSPKEMEYVEGRQDIRAMIGAAFGIPETFWRMNDANLAGSQTAQEFYARYTIAPRLAQDAEEWTETLLPLFGLDAGEYWFVYDDCIPENKAETREDVKAFVGAGVWSATYAREIVGGRGPEEDGEENPALKPKPGESDKPEKKPKGDKSHPPTICRVRTIAEYFAECDCCKAIHAKDDRPRPAESSIERIVRHWLLTIANDYDIPMNVLDVDLGSYMPELAAQLIKPIGTTLLSGVREGLAAVDAAVSVERIFPDRAVDFINQYTIRLSGEVTQTTADDIRDALSDGIARGDTLAERTAAVRKELTDSAIYRPPMIARTETSRAHNYGQLKAWENQQIEGVEWVLAPNSCPACKAFVDHFGSTRKPGEPFAKVGDSFPVPGKNAPFEIKYETIYAPPLHPNDRCGVKPVLKKLEGAT